jgi:hypothetical protein
MDVDALALASRLYGSPPAAAPDAATAPAPAAPPPDLAERLFAARQAPAVEVPDNIAALRAADTSPEARLYGPTVHEGVLDALKVTQPTAADDVVRAQALEWGQVARDVGASHEDVGLVVSTIRRFDIEPPTIEQEATMRTQAFKALDDAFGKDAPRALALARALAHRDSRLLEMLDKSGAGNDPKVLVAMARLALSEEMRGRLKRD